MKWNYNLQIPLTISPTDVIPLMNLIFHKSYDNVCANLKAVSDRGWFPPNRKLFEHPSLVDEKRNTAPMRYLMVHVNFVRDLIVS